jgi:hypothetical protein
MAIEACEEEQLDGATRAFGDLRPGVAVLRRTVEAFGPSLKENRAPDYGLILGQIAKAQAAIRPVQGRRDPSARRFANDPVR